MTVNRLQKHVPVKLGRDQASFEIFGKRYPFDRADKSGKSKAKATLDAEAYGAELLASLEQRLGRPLSTREQITGKPDPVPAPKVEGSLRKPETEPRNPYLVRAAEVERTWRTTTPDLQARKIKRLEELQVAAGQWQAKRDAQVARDAVRSSDDFIRAKAHAEQRFDELRLRSDVSQSAVDDAERALNDLDSGAISPGRYFQDLREPTPTAKSLYETPPEAANAD